MAWTFTKNGTIISGMEGSDGKDECLQVSSKDESTVVVGPCLGALREQWKINGTYLCRVHPAHGKLADMSNISGK
jgi:hypothetical protein